MSWCVLCLEGWFVKWFVDELGGVVVDNLVWLKRSRDLIAVEAPPNTPPGPPGSGGGNVMSFLFLLVFVTSKRATSPQ